MSETCAWFNLSTGATTILVEPDFDEIPEQPELCEYCGAEGGFPTLLEVTTVILCDDCQTFRTDEIFYELKGL